MVVTIYNKIHNENELTKKKKEKKQNTQTNGMYSFKLVNLSNEVSLRDWWVFVT